MLQHDLLRLIVAHVHGNDLVGLLLDDRILLIRDFPSVIKGEKKLVEAALEIAFSAQSPPEWQRSIYVAFEHGRVGVITVRCPSGFHKLPAHTW